MNGPIVHMHACNCTMGQNPKGGSISESLSLWFKFPKQSAKSLFWAHKEKMLRRVIGHFFLWAKVKKKSEIKSHLHYVALENFEPLGF